MSTINNDMSKNGLSITKIESSDTLIQFMEKCNNNFAKIVENGGGTKGDDGEKGDQGVPAKPKVPIHVWKEGDGKEFQYIKEYEIDGTYYIEYTEDLTDAKYQAGHLIMLENAHVYILEIDEVEQKLNPKFIIGLHSYDQNSIIDGKNAYVHIAYTNNLDNFDDFITDNELRDEKNETEPVTTYSLKRNATTYSGASYINDRAYMGVCSNNLQSPPTHPEAYTWFRTKGDAGEQGPQGEPGVQGPKGDTGTAAVHLELTQDYIAVPSKPGGEGVHPDYNDITLQMLLYEGDKQIPYNKISQYNIEIGGTLRTLQSESKGVITINQEIFKLITSDTTIICSATYNGNTYYKDLFIDLEDTPYELELNKNVLVRNVNDNNKLINNSLTVSVKYWMSGNWINATGGEIRVNNIKAKDYSNSTTIELSSSYNISDTDTEVKISYYKEEKELSYEILGIINSGKDGEQGGSGYGVLLSNPISVIPVGDDWKTDENIKTQSDSTFVYLYANSSDVSKNITISIPSPKNDNSDEDNNLKHFQIPENDKNKVVFTPVVEDHAFNFGSNTQYKLPITIDYQTDNFTTITNWTLTPVKGLDDIEVYVNKRVVNTTEDNFHTISVGYYLTTPNSSKTLFTSKDNNPKGYDIILTNDIKNLSKDDVLGTWSDINYNFTSGNCFVVLVDSNMYPIDYTEVIAVKDGADGTPGSDGITRFKSTVFTRSVGTPTKPTGGDFDAPNPDYDKQENKIWKDGIPDGSDPIWSSSRCFSNKEELTDAEWSVPILMCDTPDFEVIYSNLNEITDDCNPNYAKNDENEKIAFYKDADGGINGWLNETNLINKWSDDGGTDSIWMATITKTKGEWGSWTISKIKGEKGDPSIHLELTQDYIAVPSKPGGGGVHPDYTDAIKSQMLLYEGDKQIPYDKISNYYIKIGEVTQKLSPKPTYGVFEIEPGKITSDTTIICSATYNENTYYKNLFIDLEDTPYEIELNKNVLVRDVNDNILTESSRSLTVRVKYWMSGKWIDATDGEIRINNDTSNPIEYSDTTTIEDLSNYIYDSDTEARISYYKDGEELSYEVLGIISNGKNGTNGTDGDAPKLIKTDRIGFSKEDHYKDEDGTPDPNSEYWKATIGELGTLETAQPIYILYKQTWKYKNSTNTFDTYYIATTLSGTQGIEGKSRVLFYLGSFEKGKATLTGESVPGLLNDERCDYYIDQSGQAWMRTGSDEEAVGYKDGTRNNASQWKESEKVGFLQANAITADMINAGSITVDSEIATKLFALEITADKLKVNAANIEGQLSASQINVSELIVDAANITGTLKGHTIQSDKYISNSDSVPTWQIDNDGSGWLANKNIEWTADGTITIQGQNTSIGQGTSIGGAWKITTDGDIISNDGNVAFRKDGSGHIGGSYNETVQKGISWNTNGDVTFYDKIISKPEFINLSNVIDKNSYSITTTDKATYIFIDDDSKNSNDEIITNIDLTVCTCHTAYLSWFNFSTKITLDENTFCNFTILNHSSRPVEFYMTNDQLKLPFSLSRDAVLPHHNYKLLNNKNVNYNGSDNKNGSEYGIQTLILLPGSKLELCMENYSTGASDTGEPEYVQFFYINNISDFRLGYTEYSDENRPVGNPSLISTNHVLNTFNNIGGYIHPFTKGMGYSHMGFVRLIFGNYIESPDVEGQIIFKRSCYFYHNESNSSFSVLNNNIESDKYCIVELNRDYNYCIERLIQPLATFRYNICLNITRNDAGYNKVHLVAYSPIYNTVYKSEKVSITSLGEELEISFNDDVEETFLLLGKNQQNSILDLFVKIEFTTE